jgi:hypothetical protein
MNQTLKTQISKLCQETHLTWKQVLPLVLLRVRCSPTKQTGFLPYEILYGRPLPLIKDVKGDLQEIRNLTFLQQMHSLGKVLNDLHHHVQERLPISLTTDIHSFKPCNQVWIKEWNLQPLQPLQPWWREPYSVILIIPTAIKVTDFIKASPE